MKIIDRQTIMSLGISPLQCLQWIRESFALKSQASLPVKTRISPRGTDYINSMPCLIGEWNRYAVKVVYRIADGKAPNASALILLDSATGEYLALMDATWITVMRTAAAAALSIMSLRCATATDYGFIGLGNIATATLLALAAAEPGNRKNIRIYKYKNHTERFIERFSAYHNLQIEACGDMRALIRESDVVVGAATDANSLYDGDLTDYKPGVLVVPIMQKGFQNCDLAFDKVFGDDKEGLRHYQYFDQWRSFGETADVLSGAIPGREAETERILVYNKGIALHDLVFAAKIYDMLKHAPLPEVELFNGERYWV